MENNKQIKVSIHAGRQKFRLPKKKEKYALSLFGKEDIENCSGFIGVKFSLGENKALFAIYKMLDAKSPEIKEDAKLQDMGTSLEFKSKAEYYDAYGVKKKKTKRGFIEYNARESREAMHNLFKLTENNPLYYERTDWKKDKQGKEEKLTNVVAFMGSLIRIVIEGKGLTNEEMNKFRTNNLTPGELERLFTYEIDIANILVDQWKKYFMLIPNTLFEDIKQATKQIGDGRQRQDRYTPLFIEWLILQVEMRRRKMNAKKTDLGLEIKMHWKNLARTLRMDALIKKRQWGRIKEKLQKSYEIARCLGFISDCKFNQNNGIDSWEINPKHFPSFNKTRKHWQEIWHKRRNKKKASANSANIEPKQPEDIPYIPLGCK